MNTSVDVLNEMERASSRLFDAGLHGDLSLDEARAAVAELIEAAQPVAESLLALINGDNAMTPQAIMTRRITAALSRVRGSA